MRDHALAAALVLCTGVASAQQLPPVTGPGGKPMASPVSSKPKTVEGRLARVERLLDSGVLVDMATRLDQLQTDLQALRGDIELYGRDIEVMKQRQRDLYLDVDRRLRRVEVGGGAAPATPPTATTPPAAVAPTQAASPATNPPAATPPSQVASLPQPAPATPPVPAVPVADPAREQLAYQAAFDLLKEGRYPESIVAFEQFIAAYPGGAYTDNAQYWLGEARYVTRDFNAAVADFNTVLTAYPASPKVPDAMLKLGYAHYELKDWAKSRQVLTELRQKYPSSTAARLAASRLERMAQEGR